MKSKSLKSHRIMLVISLIALIVSAFLVFSPSKAHAALSPDAAMYWVVQMKTNGSPATLCTAAKYYRDHPGAGKDASWALWLKRGIELSTTESEKTYCDKIKSDIDGLEVKNAK